MKRYVKAFYDPEDENDQRAFEILDKNTNLDEDAIEFVLDQVDDDKADWAAQAAYLLNQVDSSEWYDEILPDFEADGITEDMITWWDDAAFDGVVYILPQH